VFPWQHIGPGVSTRPITTKNNTAAMSVELWLSALFWQWGGRSSNVIIKLSTNEMTCTAKLLSTTETEAATYNYQPTLSFFLFGR
jgi:hypothetical protein